MLAESTEKCLTENSNRVRRRRGSTPERPTATEQKHRHLSSCDPLHWQMPLSSFLCINSNNLIHPSPSFWGYHSKGQSLGAWLDILGLVAPEVTSAYRVTNHKTLLLVTSSQVQSHLHTSRIMEPEVASGIAHIPDILSPLVDSPDTTTSTGITASRSRRGLVLGFSLLGFLRVRHR
jgi:hypothetical protein